MRKAELLWLDGWIKQHHLPADYAKMVHQYILPLADFVALRQKTQPTLFVGLNGAQGSGKSTMAEVLAMVLKAIHGLRVAVISLDDFYFSQSQRRELADTVHPLLITRGVPGTHDVDLALNVLDACKKQGQVNIPRFDKLTDMPKSAADWDVIDAPVDVVLFEGWCVACPLQAESELLAPINDLERVQDADGRWRHGVNQQLQTAYAKLFAYVHCLVMLKAPSFAASCVWRARQEKQTFAKAPAMAKTAAELDYFMQHFERLARYQLSCMDQQADVVLILNKKQQIKKVSYREF